MKSIKINDDIHSELKLYCVKNKITITNFLEKIIIDKIKKVKDDTNKKN